IFKGTGLTKRSKKRLDKISALFCLLGIFFDTSGSEVSGFDSNPCIQCMTLVFKTGAL
ncbi:24909_t:CDS:2, partial [Gigaspora rosea]